MLKVLEHILMTWPAPQAEHRLFNDAIKDLQSESIAELQRLASKMPDHLLVCHHTHTSCGAFAHSLASCSFHPLILNWPAWIVLIVLAAQDVYDQLEEKVNQMISLGTLDEKRQIAYQSFLFIIM